MNEKRFVKSRSDRMVFGVSAGLARYFGIDPVIIRLIFVLLTLFGGHGILIYLILAIIMPDEPAVAAQAKANGFDEDEIVIKGA
jgi:phage shock protein C